MQIYILRHAIAHTARPGERDSERALTAEGRERLAAVLRRAREAGVRPQAILSSPYKRAIETAAIAADELGFSGAVESCAALTPGASPYDAWEEIRARREADALLLATHQPFAGSMTAFLLASPALEIDVKKAALIRVDCDGFGPHPHGVLKWMLTPALA